MCYSVTTCGQHGIINYYTAAVTRAPLHVVIVFFSWEDIQVLMGIPCDHDAYLIGNSAMTATDRVAFFAVTDQDSTWDFIGTYL